MGVDWAATGTWMQAWAGFAQAGTVVIAALVAANTFKSWKKQKIEERRIASSEQLLSLTYNVRRAFNVIRSPIVSQVARDEATYNLLESGVDLSSYPAKIQQRIVDAQVVLDRINRFGDVWEEFSRAIPMGSALFGQSIEDNLNAIWRQKMAIQVAAEQYPLDDGSDDEFSQDIASTLWENRQRAANVADKVGSQIATSIANLEGMLLSVIRSGVNS